MTVKAAVTRELAGWPTFQDGERTLVVQDDAQSATCRLVALDNIGCAFLSLAVHADVSSPRELADLKGAAERLADRLNYLLEPVSPIEVDSEGCTVQMRSSPPQKDDDGTSYYELLITRAGELSLSRYQRSAGAERRQVPAHVTREVLLRLVHDFAAAL